VEGTIGQVEAEGLVLEVHWFTGKRFCSTTIASRARANVEIPYAGTRQRVWKSEIGIACLMWYELKHNYKFFASSDAFRCRGSEQKRQPAGRRRLFLKPAR
jgi:hypothetical protein